jgi:alpha-tubulin suppressor-like RCC1 family protein
MHITTWKALLILTAAALPACGGSEDPVAPNPETASVIISPDEVALKVGESQQLTAVPHDASGNPLTGRTISWTTSAAGVATVSNTGLVQAKSSGAATIRATADGKTGEAAVSVTLPPVASVTVSSVSAALLVGVSEQWTAQARDAAGNAIPGIPLTWSTSNPAVAIVSNAGVVLALAEGSATISAAAEGNTGSAPLTVSALVFASFAAGGAHTCALTAAGGAYCWGRAESGQLGVPVPSTTCATDAGSVACIRTAVPVGGGLTFASLAAGGAHTCGLTGDGTAYCWGSNASGQLGDNTTTRRTDPVAVITQVKFASLDLGEAHTCGLSGAGAAHCWGDNTRGQLGDATTVSRPVPGPVGGGHTFTQIAAGGFNIGHTCALTADGTAYCWGDNEDGQLGIGSTDLDAHPIPAEVAGNIVFASVTAGLGSHSCGRTAAGAAYCWGADVFGALGNGSAGASSLPAPASGAHAFEQLVAGGFIGHTCALKDGGAAWCWGENERGQVGDGSTVDRFEPVEVTGGRVFGVIDAGYRHTCGRSLGGVIYCWGSGATGQLGLNSVESNSQPRKVLGQP